MVSLSEFGAIFAMQGFNGLSVFCVLLLMALGLAIIFGQMGVINMAHGEFLTIGAYITYLLSQLTTHYAPGLQPYYFFGAIVLSWGFYLRVLWNHLQAVRFWRRNIRYRGAHAVRDSPIYGEHHERPQVKGWQGGSLGRSAIRLLGENPFILSMLVAATPTLVVEWWGQRMYWWSIAILGWAIAVTFIRPLRVVGPGFLYMKASVFPTAFSLALLVGAPGGLTSAAGLIVVLSFLLSVGAITVWYVYLRRRRSERTSSTPPDLAAIASDLQLQPGDRVLCLPSMYSDFLSYASGKKVLWGGHSGDLTRYEALAPVIRRSLGELIDEYQISYVVLDLAYTDPEEVRLSSRLDEVARRGNFVLYRTQGETARSS